MAREARRRRTAARLAAVQALYQREQTGEAAEAVIEEFILHRLGGSATGDYEEGFVPGAETSLFARIVRATAKGQAEHDLVLASVLPSDWPITRLDPVLRALLRAGLAELAMTDGPPARVVINEYVDVAHGFFDLREPRLANGVLDRLGHILRPREFASSAAP